MSGDRRKEIIRHLSEDDLDRLLSEADDPKVVRRLTFVKNLYKGDSLDEPDSGNVLGNSRTFAETRRLRTGHHLSRTFPETRKRHAAAYREREHLVEYGRTFNVEPVGSESIDTRG